MLRAIFFGSVGTLAETSQLQCQAFNNAFDEAGLDWFWKPNEYRELLREPGGVKRIRAEAKRRNQSVDAETIHARKVAHFHDLVTAQGLVPRPGVVETLEWARAEGIMVSWVTTTGCDTIDLILMGLRNSLSASSFSFILDATSVKLPKPAPDIYCHALKRAGIGPDNAIAIEDTPESASASLSAGIKTVAFPGWAAAERRFPQGIKSLDVLSAEALVSC